MYNLPHSIGYHGKEEGCTTDTSPLNSSKAAPYWSREDTPEDVIVTQHVEETSLQEKSFWGGCVHRRRRNLDLRCILISVNGQPAISKEAELFASLEIVEDHIAEVPRLHLSYPTVVVPNTNVLQVAEWFVNGHQESVHRSLFEEVLGRVREGSYLSRIFFFGQNELDF